MAAAAVRTTALIIILRTSSCDIINKSRGIRTGERQPPSVTVIFTKIEYVFIGNIFFFFLTSHTYSILIIYTRIGDSFFSDIGSVFHRREYLRFKVCDFFFFYIIYAVRLTKVAHKRPLTIWHFVQKKNRNHPVCQRHSSCVDFRKSDFAVRAYP